MTQYCANADMLQMQIMRRVIVNADMLSQCGPVNADMLSQCRPVNADMLSQCRPVNADQSIYAQSMQTTQCRPVNADIKSNMALFLVLRRLAIVVGTHGLFQQEVNVSLAQVIHRGSRNLNRKGSESFFDIRNVDRELGLAHNLDLIPAPRNQHELCPFGLD
jgi:hypothetical protein